MPGTVHVLPGEQDDWVVKEEGGRELGHYPDRPAAEAVGLKIARRRKAELRVYNRSGAIERRSRPARGWLMRTLFGR